MNKKKTKCIKDYITNYNSIAIGKLMISIMFGLFNLFFLSVLILENEYIKTLLVFLIFISLGLFIPLLVTLDYIHGNIFKSLYEKYTSEDYCKNIEKYLYNLSDDNLCFLLNIDISITLNFVFNVVIIISYLRHLSYPLLYIIFIVMFFIFTVNIDCSITSDYTNTYNKILEWRKQK